MNQAEKKQRIRQLWTKVRLFVRMRSRLSNIRTDMEVRELREMMDQPIPSDDEDNEGDEDYNSDDEVDGVRTPSLPWYKFNVNGYQLKVWDSFFALFGI